MQPGRGIPIILLYLSGQPGYRPAGGGVRSNKPFPENHLPNVRNPCHRRATPKKVHLIKNRHSNALRVSLATGTTQRRTA
jgi:hypothetical protein